MATYRQIHTKMWRDRKFEKLGVPAKLLFIYLWSNDHRNELCLYEVTLKTISDETGIPLENLKDAIAELCRCELIDYDFDNEVVWVRNALKYQVITPKSFISIVRNFSQVNSPLAEKAANALREVVERYSNTFGIPLEYLSNGIPIVSEYQAGNGKGKGKGKGKNIKDIAAESLTHANAFVKDSAGQKPGKVSRYDEDDKALVKALKTYREECGAPPTEHDWHLHQLAIVKKLRRKGYTTQELLECLEDARKDPYWAPRLDSWATVERYLPKWKLRRSRDQPKKPLDDDISWIPFEPSVGRKGDALP